jgi:hypothetical protein
MTNMVRATVVDPNIPAYRLYKQQWIEGHPDYKLTQEELVDANRALEKVPWQADALEFAESKRVAEETRHNAQKEVQRVTIDLSNRFDSACSTD